jgi:quinol monooxygenase YgiN
MTAPPLVIASSALPQVSQSELIAECRKLLHNDGDWLFLTSSTEFLAFQLYTHNLPISATEALFQEIFHPILPHISFQHVEPTLGFVQRPDQKIPVDAYTTIVKYRITPGKRAQVVDDCRDLFAFAEKEELDVYSLAIMNNVNNDDEFVILERYEDESAERRHMESERLVACLEKIKDFIAERDSRNYTILDV